MALHPVGPLPAATYWRRRLVLLAVLVGVVLLARSVLGGGDEEPTTLGTTATPTPGPSVTRQATPRPTGSAAPTSCPDGALTLSVTPEAGEHRAGAPLRFTVTVKNVSRTGCRRDLADRFLEVVVRSGADRIWSSDDCSPDSGLSPQFLAAGASLQTTVTWPGKRSARGCPTARPEARPGTYTVRARLATLRSAAAVFRLTA